MVNCVQSKEFKLFAFWGGLVLFLLTAFFNLGIIAIDDYAFVISQTIPAQMNSSSEILKNTGLWHPILPFFLHLLSSTAFKLGISDPYHQLQFVLVIIAAFSFLLQAYFLPRFFANPLEQNIGLAFLSFYFLSPLIFTRPMIEAIAAPFLLISAFFGHRYYKEGSFHFLWYSVFALSFAALIRYQVGVCAFALVLIVALRKSFPDFIQLLLALLSGFLVTGGLDYFLTGQFHGSIKSYLSYNLFHSSANHGQQPFYVFLLLFFGLTLPPVFLSKYKGLDWRKTYSEYLVPLSFFIFFLLSHTVTPHKEERFMIPVLPLFFVCLTPLAAFLIHTSTSQWRLRLFIGINTLLLLLTSFSVPQSNIVGLVRFLDRSPSISKIYSWADTLVVFPTAFSNRTLDHKEINNVNSAVFASLRCGEVVAFREAYKSELPSAFSQLTHVASFVPGPLEALLVKLNPKRNARRGTIEVFGKKGCP